MEKDLGHGVSILVFMECARRVYGQIASGSDWLVSILVFMECARRGRE